MPHCSERKFYVCGLCRTPLGWKICMAILRRACLHSTCTLACMCHRLSVGRTITSHNIQQTTRQPIYVHIRYSQLSNISSALLCHNLPRCIGLLPRGPLPRGPPPPASRRLCFSSLPTVSSVLANAAGSPLTSCRNACRSTAGYLTGAGVRAEEPFFRKLRVVEVVTREEWQRRAMTEAWESCGTFE